MKLPHLFVLLLSLAVLASAGELLPEIAPLAQRHRTAVDALSAQRAAALARAQKPYLTALDGAEKAAVSAAQLPVVAEIGREREAIVNGTASAAFPVELPKTLQTERRAYFEALTRILNDDASRQKRVDADYLADLALLQSRAAANAPLVAQIKAEKEAVLTQSESGAAGAAGGHAASAVTGAHAKDVLTQKIVGKWNMSAKKDFSEGGREISFAADGTGMWGQSAGKWEAIDGKSVKFRYGTITFAPDFKTFVYSEGGKSEYGKRGH